MRDCYKEYHQSPPAELNMAPILPPNPSLLYQNLLLLLELFHEADRDLKSLGYNVGRC
jgi:hypothetical protein